MAKYRKSNKKTKKNNSRNNKTRNYKKMRKGGCGCNINNDNIIMKGGYGPSNFSSLPQSQYYSYSNNPNAISFPLSSRIINGGKKTKKMRGGNVLQNWITNHPFGNNSVMYTGDTAGAFLGSNVYNGIPNFSNSITDGPLLNTNRSNIV
uniref:Uncharacterized protein n=1 Tax=viral metagenome TaxID=1070528 RepID=A0A6C0DC05_9ZZZZ